MIRELSAHSSSNIHAANNITIKANYLTTASSLSGEWSLENAIVVCLVAILSGRHWRPTYVDVMQRRHPRISHYTSILVPNDGVADGRRANSQGASPSFAVPSWECMFPRVQP
jgi:hypothetical protein